MLRPLGADGGSRSCAGPCHGARHIRSGALIEYGRQSIRPLTPTLALLNLRLGYWMDNPRKLEPARALRQVGGLPSRRSDGLAQRKEQQGLPDRWRAHRQSRPLPTVEAPLQALSSSWMRNRIPDFAFPVAHGRRTVCAHRSGHPDRAAVGADTRPCEETESALRQRAYPRRISNTAGPTQPSVSSIMMAARRASFFTSSRP